MTSNGSITAAGGLLSHDLLQRVAKADPTLAGLRPVDYQLAPDERVRDQTARSWSRLVSRWAAFRQAETRLAETDPTATTLTRQRWLQPLLQELGFAGIHPFQNRTIGEKDYPISHQWGNHVPLHLLGWRVPIDRRKRGIPGAAKTSPHSLIQEFLNRSDQHLWGIVTNGQTLRILRDNASLTRVAYYEADLQAIFDGNRYSDFVTLWRTCHRSRFDAPTPEQCILEQWNNEAATRGIRALDQLREGVEEAIRQLGQGFLSHRHNQQLQQQIRSGQLPADQYLHQLLRLVYRMLFLLVAESRDLLHPPDTPDTARRRYHNYYSMNRLQNLSRQRRRTAHTDLWQSLQVTMAALDANSAGLPQLGLPPLGSRLWSPDATPALNQSHIDNRHLLNAVHRLSYVRDTHAKTLRPIDYRNLGTEELGSVYESLLELHADINGNARTFNLAAAAGSERKTTGSYYTPTPLIDRVLADALDPILKQAGRTPDPEAALLNLRVLDPACGSGHFLINAAHRIAKRLASIRAGGTEPNPLEERVALRDVIGQCVYGIDINPLAAELCKTALWLEANNRGQPLSYLDHHIVCGNSLLGTTPDLIAQGIPNTAYKHIVGDDKQRLKQLRTANRNELKQRNQELLPLRWSTSEEITALADDMAFINTADDATTGDVATKAALHEELQQSDSYTRAKRVADSWSAAFVIPKTADHPAITDSTIRAIAQGRSVDPDIRRVVNRLADQYQFLHPHIAFPDIHESGGFDAVIGNPPWEKVKLHEREWFANRVPEIAAAGIKTVRQKLVDALEREDPDTYAEYQAAARHAASVSGFLRNTGRYPLGARGDTNTYPVFTELMRNAISPEGRVGVIVPTGIATDNPTRHFFADLINSRSLVSLYDFENKKQIFPAVHSSARFCLLTLTGRRRPAKDATFVFFAHEVSDIDNPDKRFVITAEDFALLNPNTRTTPTFRRRRDADIATAVHRRLPILVREGDPTGNPWEMEFQQMFHMTNDAHLFRTRSELEDDGWTLVGNHFVRGDQRYLPLYEGKMAGMHDHRAADVIKSPTARQRQRQPRYIPTTDKKNPNRLAIPLNWVPGDVVAERVHDARGWLAGFSDATSVTNQRTMICSAIPHSAVSLTERLVYTPGPQHLLLAVLGSFAFDFVARQKIGGTHFTFVYLKQMPVPPPTIVEEAAAWITPHMLELSYTAWDIAPFGADLGYQGPPFRWDNQRRALIRAEIDALMFRLYQISRADVDYILDTFQRIQKDSIKQWGEYRTKRLILERYDAMVEADRHGHSYQTVLDPPPADPSVAHDWSTRPDWYPLTFGEATG